ncbi:hypothetical protein HY468_02125 [Candidatus Roizmanbacteria bacterium]|nr:hypothetical protein [Candidatus Roizmanbacteria bacterium]
MAQLSKYPMDKQLEERMYEVFYQTLADLKTSESVQEFLCDLLSKSEQTMLAKRLAIAVLLVKGANYAYIRDVLKVSTSTVVAVHSWLESGGVGYQRAIDRLIRQEKTEAFLDTIEEVIERITIPRPHTDWRKARSETWQRRQIVRNKRAL